MPGELDHPAQRVILLRFPNGNQNALGAIPFRARSFLALKRESVESKEGWIVANVFVNIGNDAVARSRRKAHIRVVLMTEKELLPSNPLEKGKERPCLLRCVRIRHAWGGVRRVDGGRCTRRKRRDKSCKQGDERARLRAYARAAHDWFTAISGRRSEKAGEPPEPQP